MNKWIGKIETNLDKLFGSLAPLTWAVGFLSVMLVRLFVESFLANTGDNHIDSLFASFEGVQLALHNTLFFLITMLLLWLCLSFFLRKNVFSLARLMLVASIMIIFPPVIDMIATGGSVFWSFYLLNDVAGLGRSFVTVFSDLPSGVFYFGTRILLLSSVALVSGAVYVKTKVIARTLLSALSVYVIYFLLASIPSWLTYLYYFFQGNFAIQKIKIYQIVQFIATPTDIFSRKGPSLEYALAYNLNLVYFLLLLVLLGVLFYSGSRQKFWAVVKNARLPQLIYHAGLLFIGLGLGYLAYPQNLTLNPFAFLAILVLLSSVWLAWVASVVINDIYDFEIDTVSNPDRPLEQGIFDIKDAWQLAGVLVILSLLGGLLIGPKFFELILLYQVLAWFYSGKIFRLKKFPVVATFVSACATLLVLFMGFCLFSGAQNLHGLSGRLIALLLIALTLSLPIKDFKDMAGDRKDGIWTIPVLFGEERGRLIVATGVFISFMLSVFLLNETKLFIWALFFGIASFWLIQSKKIHPRNIFWWLLGTVGLYGLLLVKIVFWPLVKVL